MMHFRWLVPVLAAIGVACASTPTAPVVPPVDAGDDRDPCAGLGCPVGLASITFRIVGPSGTPVRNPFFTEGGKQLVFQCVLVDPDASDASATDADDAGDAGGPVCAKWQMYFPAGPHTITIDALGYVSQTLALTLKGPTGCCGQGEQLEKTVTLASQ
jgi:hypothetical protein